MASLIQLKQIESSSALIAATEVGADFSQSVIDVVTGNIQAVLPTGIISSSTQLTASFDERYILSGSITQTTWDNIVGKPDGLVSSSAQITYTDISGIPQGIISGASQLDGATLKNITITTDNADMYSLIVSGAIGVVDATGLTGSLDGDDDTTVPAQIYLTGQPLPTDPAISGSAEANQIDMGEW